MKRNLLVFSFLLFATGLIAGNGFEVNYSQIENGTHQLNFTLGEYTLGDVSHDGVNYTNIDYEGSITTKLNGFAQLPYIHSSVALPDNKNVKLSVILGDYEDYYLSNPLLPSRGVIYRNQIPSEIPYSISPSSMRDEWYPKNIATKTSPYIIRDIRGTTVHVYPFRYNAVQNVLRVYHEVTVVLTEDETSPINPLLVASDEIVREMDPLYRSMFVNYGQSKDLTVGEYGDILILCTDRDEDVMEPYAEWKKEKGYNVSSQTVETGTNVKEIIQDAYDDNNDLLYVQLVGDWADIKCDLFSGYAPMDPQLGCVVGSDDHPDITIGRFSGNSADDIAIQVAKVIDYEKNPEVDGEWYSAALGVASNEGSGDDNEYDNEQIDVIWEDKLEPFTYETFYDNYDPGASAQNVADDLNTGVSIANYCGHGSSTTWVSSGFSNAHVNGLDNENRLPIIFSVACVNGAFHNATDCFAEAWLKKEDGGAVMTMMATINQPWDPPMRGQDYFNDLLVGGYDYDDHPGQSGTNTDEGRTTIGAITFNGLVLMTAESGGSSDWETAKTWILFGDPSMQPRTAAPGDLTLSNDLLLVGAPFTSTVTGPDGALEGAMVCISQDDVYVSAVTDETGSVSFDQDFTPGTARLVVTAFNMETIYEEITVVPPTGAYVILSASEVDDANGNNNGQADYGEAVQLNISAENVGSEDVSSVSATLISEDPYISIVDDSHDFGDISAGSIIEGIGAFEVTVSADAPDGHAALMNVEFSDGSESLWVSTMNVMLHAPQLDMGAYTITDLAGNGNNSIDPGETVDITIQLLNTGSSDAYNVEAEISCEDTYITIEQAVQNYGDILAESGSEQTFSITADINTPVGHSITLDLTVNGDLEQSAMLAFDEIVGRIPVLILDLDANGNSAEDMVEALSTIELVSEYTTSFPDDLSLYSSVFLCLGIYSDNHTLSSDEGQKLADYLSNGGNLYMEGGDTWYFDSSTPVHDMFGVNPTSDGSGDLGDVDGQDGTFTEGMSFNYSGENNYIDHIDPTGSAFSIFKNDSPLYGAGVAYDQGDYKTIAASFEFGGLDDATTPSTKQDLMNAYLAFFGFESTLTASFSSNTVEICENEVVDYFDNSYGDIISWSWEFEGGQPETSTDQNPQVEYASAGVYNVTLTVSDGTDTHTLTLEDYITVDICSGIEKKIFDKISVYPNPNNGIFTVEFSNVLSNFVNIKVLNALSKEVYSKELTAVQGDFSKTIDLSNLDKGLYFLVIENYQGSTVNRIIIR